MSATTAACAGSESRTPAPTTGSGELVFTPERGDSNKYVGNYLIDKTVGEGAFGKVKLGRHVITGAKVAIKILEKDRITDMTDRERVNREIRIMRLLNHDSIIKLHDVYDSPRHIYLILEYACGGELFDYIVAHERVQEKEARKFFRQMIAGVMYCHQLHIIHRDLKPENLLLDADRNIKIIDFGFSNTMKPGSMLRTFCGSPAYAAPEMIAGRAYTGPEVDIWSLGVILFALLCGYLPFDHSNLSKLYQQILRGDFSFPDHLSPGSKHLISRMLTIPPEKRATLEEVRQHPWIIECYHGPVEAPPLPYMQVSEDEIDEEVLREVQEIMGSHKAATRQALLNGERNQVHEITGVYFLLSEKKVQSLKEKDKHPSPAAAVAAVRMNPMRRRGSSSGNMASMPGIDENSPQTLPPGSPKVGGAAGAAAALGSLGAETKHDNGRRHSIAVPNQSANVTTSSVKPNVAAPPDLHIPGQEDADGEMPTPPTAAATLDINGGGATSPDVRRRRATESDASASPALASPSGQPLTPQAAASNSNVEAVKGRQQQRRFSLDAAMSSLARAFSNSGKTAPDIRVIKYTGAFSVSTTSSKPPQEIMEELKRVLIGQKISLKEVSPFVIECIESSGIRFEAEIVKLRDLPFNGLRLKRITGDTWAYKSMCDLILADLRL